MIFAPATVVGPVCESGDTFSRSRRLPPLPANASVAILGRWRLQCDHKLDLQRVPNGR